MRLIRIRTLSAVLAALTPSITAAGPAPAPPALTYSPYSRDGAVVLRWQAGAGTSSRVYQQTQGGGWRRIYSGSADRLELGPLPDGSYRFAVETCRAGGRCARQGGGLMTVRRPASIESGAPSPRAAGGRPQPAPRQAQGVPGPDGDLLWLGQGWNTMTGEPRKLCLDLSQYPDPVRSSESTEGPNQIEVARNNSELASLLEIEAEAGVSAAFAGFNANAGGRVRLYRSSRMWKENTMIVIKWVRRHEHWQFPGGSSVLSPYYTRMLDPANDGRSPALFHQECGDSIVHAVNTGARAFLVLTFNHYKMTAERTAEVATQVKLRVGKLLAAGFAGSWSSADRQYFEDIQLSIRAYAEGGPAGVLGTPGALNPDQALASVQQWISQLGEHNYVAIDKFRSRYELPQQWLDRAYYSVFVDPHPITMKLRRWTSADLQVAIRCDFLNGANSARYWPRCFEAKRLLEDGITSCVEALRWDACIDPEGGSALQHVAERVPAMDPTSVRSVIPYFTSSRGCHDSGDVTVCLPDADCLGDWSRTYTEPDYRFIGNTGGPGYGVFITSVNAPGGGSAVHRWYDDGDRVCLTSRVAVCAKRRQGGSYSGFQDLYGFCPVTRPLELE